MRCIDVNVLVFAYRQELPQHDAYQRQLEMWANDYEPLGVPDVVLSGFVRITTNRRVFNEPSPTSEAWDRVEDLLAAPAIQLLRPGSKHWQHFTRLARQIDAKGNDLRDAFIAAYAVENNATFLSSDRGFKRFDDLRWQHPLTERGRAGN